MDSFLNGGAQVTTDRQHQMHIYILINEWVFVMSVCTGKWTTLRDEGDDHRELGPQGEGPEYE